MYEAGFREVLLRSPRAMICKYNGSGEHLLPYGEGEQEEKDGGIGGRRTGGDLVKMINLR